MDDQRRPNAFVTGARRGDTGRAVAIVLYFREWRRAGKWIDSAQQSLRSFCACSQGSQLPSSLEVAMRMILAALMLSAAVTTAHAYYYPWCVCGGELGASGNCSFETREQCLATAFGMSQYYCAMNKRVLFKQRESQPKKVPHY
jgi:hypothetical protein